MSSGPRRGRRAISASSPPGCRRILDLTRQVADHRGHDGERYDALLDQFEPGMKTAEVRAMFEAIKPDSGGSRPGHRRPGTGRRRRLSLEADLTKRRSESSASAWSARWALTGTGAGRTAPLHPFCTSFGRDDVRITTRFDPHFLPMALFGSIHETGHALYEQGVAAALCRQHSVRRRLRWASMRASRGCGKIWSGAAVPSGNASTPICRRSSRIRWPMWNWKAFTARSTKWSHRSSAWRRTK